MTRDHKGIAYRERQAGVANTRDGRSLDHAAQPSTSDPRRAVCAVAGCGRKVHYVRRTYGPRGKAGHWQHTGDGLAQFRAWK